MSLIAYLSNLICASGFEKKLPTELSSAFWQFDPRGECKAVKNRWSKRVGA